LHLVYAVCYPHFALLTFWIWVVWSSWFSLAAATSEVLFILCFHLGLAQFNFSSQQGHAPVSPAARV
jgi:hypothetical protein